MRFANQVWKLYRDNGTFQDVFETLTGAGISAGGQLLFTDMTPEEIALSTTIGAGAAMLARPSAAFVGSQVGRVLDKTVAKNHQDGLREWGANKVQEGIRFYRDAADAAPNPSIKNAINKMADGMQAGVKAKYNQNYVNADGTPKGVLEGFLGHQGRTRGDNIAQYAIAVGTPFIGNSGSETDETGQAYGSM